MASDHDIHDTAHIGDGVVLGQGVRIGPGAVLLGPARIGDRVFIGPNSVIGSPPEISSLPQNAAWAGDLDHAGVVIEHDVVIRDLVVIHQGSHRPTTIGRGSWLLNSVYAAHDVLIGEEVTVSAGVRLGGHVVVGDRANLGMGAVVHQRRVVGAGAMVGMGTPLTGDVPPFAKAYGSPPRLHGLNTYLLTRLQVDDTQVQALAGTYASGRIAPDEDTPPALRGALQHWTDARPERTLKPEQVS